MSYVNRMSSLYLALSVAAAISPVAAAPSAAPGSTVPSVGFHRYISPPLQDGTRYTFLYPAYFGKVRQGWLNGPHQFDCVRIDTVGVPPVPWTASRGGVAVSYRLYNKGGASWPAPHEEFCSVLVGVSSPPLRGSVPPRVESRWVGPDGSHHDISLTDARTHLRFRLIHEERYIPALFQQTDPVISGSFRILPPGTAAPVSTERTGRIEGKHRRTA